MPVYNVLLRNHLPCLPLARYAGERAKRPFLGTVKAMLCVLSPAKKLAANPPQRLALTTPRLVKDATILARQLARFSPTRLASLMSISDQLAQLNVARFQAWKPVVDKDASAALLSFSGDVYAGFDAASMNDSMLEQAQERVRMLSGLYGLLRPLDGIYPYRLEMGSKLSNPRGATLYAFWCEQVTQLLSEDLRAINAKVVVNLASNEYAKAVNWKGLGCRVITPRFYDTKNGTTRMLQFYVKRARGLMARFMLENAATTATDLLAFNAQGYSYDHALSNESQPAFVRVH